MLMLINNVETKGKRYLLTIGISKINLALDKQEEIMYEKERDY